MDCIYNVVVVVVENKFQFNSIQFKTPNRIIRLGDLNETLLRCTLSKANFSHHWADNMSLQALADRPGPTVIELFIYV